MSSFRRVGFFKNRHFVKLTHFTILALHTAEKIISANTTTEIYSLVVLILPQKSNRNVISFGSCLPSVQCGQSAVNGALFFGRFSSLKF